MEVLRNGRRRQLNDMKHLSEDSGLSAYQIKHGTHMGLLVACWHILQLNEHVYGEISK